MTWKISFILCLLVLSGFGCDTLERDKLELEREKFFLEQDKESRLIDSAIFDRRVTCQNMVDKFKARYNNVTGGMYNAFSNSCDIEFTDENGIKTHGAMDTMSDD